MDKGVILQGSKLTYCVI